jgi:threonine synthase
VVSTAHPAKFEQVVEPLIGTAVEVPQNLAMLLDKPSSFKAIPSDYRLLFS